MLPLDSLSLPRWHRDRVLSLAEPLTGRQGDAALVAFCRQLVVGAARDEGLVDQINADMRVVYDLPYVRLGPRLRVLSALCFSLPGTPFVWVLGDVDAQLAAHKTQGAVLVVLGNDASFLFASSELLLSLVSGGRLTLQQDDLLVSRMAEAWSALAEHFSEF